MRGKGKGKGKGSRKGKGKGKEDVLDGGKEGGKSCRYLKGRAGLRI